MVGGGRGGEAWGTGHPRPADWGWASAVKGAMSPSALRWSQHTRPWPDEEGPGSSSGGTGGNGGGGEVGWEPWMWRSRVGTAVAVAGGRCGLVLTRITTAEAEPSPTRTRTRTRTRGRQERARGPHFTPVPDGPSSQSPLSADGAAAWSPALPAAGAFGHGPSGWPLGGGGAVGGQPRAERLGGR